MAPNTGALDRGNAGGRATRELLMLTAERLFAERGFEAVPLREIGREAEQRNPAVTQYHFGTRDELVHEIYAYRSEGLNERRFELLRDLEARGAAHDPRALMRALLLPHAESIGDPENHFLGFLNRLIADRGRLDLGGVGREDIPLAAYDDLRDRIAKQFPKIPNGVFERRFELVFNWAIEALATFELRTTPSAPVDTFVDDLVAMLTAALGAEAPRARRARRSPAR
jgi:AcrR family transcriptional regulator